MKLESFKEKNKKKKGIIIFTLCCVFLIIGGFFYQSFALFETKENFNFIEGQVQDPGDLYFAYYVDGEIVFDIPSKESGYAFSDKSFCNNGVTIAWDRLNWSAGVNLSNYEKQNTSKTKCTLYFEKAMFSQKVTACGNSGDAASICVNKYKEMESSLVDDETNDHNIRYTGASPNNYIDIGDRDADGNIILWRIIGVMNNIDDGNGKKDSRLKIRRDSDIGAFPWSSTDTTVNAGRGVNEWSQASVMKLMNPGFESETVGGSLYWNGQSGTCYIEGLETMPCNFTNTGLSSTAKSYISKAVWNTSGTGSYTCSTLLTNHFYEIERSDNTGKICNSGSGQCSDNVTRTTTWTGYVGLITPSDYGYATSGGATIDRKTCLSTTLNTWGNTSVIDCKNNDWLYSNHLQWTIMPMASTSNANSLMGILDKGGIAGYGAQALVVVNPVVYLNANVRITSGEGTEDSPFAVSIG